eukprot:TRINITY_DN5963_c1_g1_i1.p1 TRINITY_DN5963_c1_g1~~TRINITY_DN5963_c1_g1_i1.p1  ORF type:complete len:562 (+),score=170.45 TRINITY_DN5963_c1_g1_i1:78-1763(+)
MGQCFGKKSKGKGEKSNFCDVVPSPHQSSSQKGSFARAHTSSDSFASIPNDDEHAETKVTSVVHFSYDEDGNKMVNEYVILRLLGRGQYGKVKLAMNMKDNQLYAIKILNKSILKRIRKGFGKNAYSGVLKEIAIWKKLRHENVVRLFEVIDDPDEDRLFLVTEFVEDGCVASLDVDGSLVGGPVDEENASHFMRQSCLGLRYLHDQRIIHKDIKPENILRGGDRIALADFGVSDMFEGEDDRIRATDGTPAFMPPEAFDQHATKYSGKRADVWSLGVTLYALLVGKTPFSGDSYVDICNAIREADPELPDELSAEARDLVKRMLAKNPEDRITLDEILIHPFVTQSGYLSESESIREAPLMVTDDDIHAAVTEGSRRAHIGNVSTLVLLKTRLSKLARRAKERSRRRLHESSPEKEDTAPDRHSGHHSPDSHRDPIPETESEIEDRGSQAELCPQHDEDEEIDGRHVSGEDERPKSERVIVDIDADADEEQQDDHGDEEVEDQYLPNVTDTPEEEEDSRLYHSEDEIEEESEHGNEMDGAELGLGDGNGSDEDETKELSQ